MSSEENKPVFSTVEDVKNYIDMKAKEYGSRNEFLSSEEYKEIYPEVVKVYDKAKAAFEKEASTVLEEAGIKYGDRVFYGVVSPFGFAETMEGTVVERKGLPYVKLDTPTIRGRKFVQWHKGFRLVKGKGLAMSNTGRFSREYDELTKYDVLDELQELYRVYKEWAKPARVYVRWLLRRPKESKHTLVSLTRFLNSDDHGVKYYTSKNTSGTAWHVFYEYDEDDFKVFAEDWVVSQEREDYLDYTHLWYKKGN